MSLNRNGMRRAFEEMATLRSLACSRPSAKSSFMQQKSITSLRSLSSLSSPKASVLHQYWQNRPVHNMPSTSGSLLRSNCGIPSRSRYLSTMPSRDCRYAKSYHQPSIVALCVYRRHFRTSRTHRDMFFVTVPAFKQALLTLTRFVLVSLPFWYRWRLFKRFPKASRIFFIPLFAFLLVIALGLDQSKHTHRWRLLLMSEREEMEWSKNRFETIMEELGGDGQFILPGSDSRTKLIKKICDRLLSSLDDLDTPCISAAAYLRNSDEIVDKMRQVEKRAAYAPSAKTATALMPFRPPTSNPQKVLVEAQWEIFLIDSPAINAFVLPSREIFVNSGLVDLLDNDEELLSAVLAHEIAHVVERHSVENLGFLALNSVVFDVLRGVSWALLFSFPFINDGLAAVYNFIDHTLAERAYSRKLETEADSLSLEIMAQAGYNPEACSKLWQFLTDVEHDQTHKNHEFCLHNAPLMRTHPTGEERLKNIAKHMKKADKLYKDFQHHPHNIDSAASHVHDTHGKESKAQTASE